LTHVPLLVRSPSRPYRVILAEVRRILLWIVFGLVAVLALTGLWLTAAFSGDVRFILIGGAEVTQGTYRLWLLVHTVALTVGFAAVLAVVARVRR